MNPVIIVLLLAGLSYLGYFGSRRIGNVALRQALATITGALYFFSMVLGPLYIFTLSYIRGASLFERILATLLIPFLWMTKDVLVLTESHPFLECLYWYLNPLYIWMACLLAMEMGLGTLIARALLKRQGVALKVVTPAPVVFIVAGFVIFVAIYAWGQGENLFSLYLEGYRFLFGPGV